MKQNKKYNQKKVENLFKQIIIEIGENPDREGLKDTPKRVAKMYKEIFRGYMEKPPKITSFNNGCDGIIYDELICDEGTFYSHCEHHAVPFFGRYYWTVLPHPKGKLIGLSKVARVVDYFSAKMQIQERLVHDIVTYIYNEMSKNTKYPPLGMALTIEAEHLCKTMRGVKKKGLMRTTKLIGCFKTDKDIKKEFEDFVNRKK